MDGRAILPLRAEMDCGKTFPKISRIEPLNARVGTRSTASEFLLSGPLTDAVERDPTEVRGEGEASRMARYVCLIKTVLLAALLFSVFPTFILAAPAAPTLDHLFPVAVQAGTTNVITASGKFDPWPAKVWVDAPGITFTTQTNSGKLNIAIAPNALVGPHFVRIFNESGASGPRFLIVTREPQTAETEPNDDFKKPQIIDWLPASLNGRLDKNGDVDSFVVTLDAGQTLIASIEAFTLASPVDAVLRLVDSRGVQVALNHDDGRTFDPMLVWTASVAGRYIVQVFGFAYPANSDVRFTGNSNCVYRLHLSAGPRVHYTVPLGVQRGKTTALQLFGWNQSSKAGNKLNFDGSTLPANATEAVLREREFENELVLAVGEGPELMQAALGTNELTAPFAVTGCIAKPGLENRVRFSAKKEEKLLLEIQSAALGFPLDAWLKIEDTQGTQLAKNDDNRSADPALEWTAPEDGTFVAAVGNVLHRGGPECLYRLSGRRAWPSLKAVVAENAFKVEPGKTNNVKVTVRRRHGDKSKLMVWARNLPAGVTQKPEEISESGGEVTLKLVASTDAPPFSGPIQIVALAEESGREYYAVNELVTSGSNNGVPNGFNRLVIDSIDQLWLTILPTPPTSSKSTK